MARIRYRKLKAHPNYRVFEDGRVYSEYSGRFLKPHVNKKGYFSVSLNYKVYKVARLVLLAFKGLSRNPLRFHAAHLDGNKANNVLSNLKWCTPAENNSHRHIHGTVPLGSKCVSAKLTEQQVLDIRRRFKRINGITSNLIALAKEYGVSNDTVASVLNREYWRHI